MIFLKHWPEPLTDPIRKILSDQYPQGGFDGARRPLISGDGARAYYRHGYYNATMDIIAGLLSKRGTLESAMPALFMGCHYIELATKDLLAKAGAFDIEQSDKKFGHNLEALAEEAEKVLQSYDDEYAVRLGELKPFVLELHEADRRADAFRYATDNKGEPHFDKTGAVDVAALQDALKSAYALFEEALSDMEQADHDMDEAIRDAVDRDPF